MALPSLLEATFTHAQGIGPTTERRLWQAGARDWQSYLDVPDTTWPLTAAQRALLTPTIEESRLRLEAEDFAWFAKLLPASEHWRAVPAFGHRLAFVDIETTGGMDPSDLTVVGIFDGHTMRHFVKGVNLHEVPDALADAAMLITFFGTGFDIPFLKRAFPQMPLPQMHVDLCYLLKKLGYRGGLKSIENQLGIQRSNATTGLSGWDAVRLWHEFRAGRQKSLEVLLEYNAEDVRNMSDLLAEGYRRMARRILTEY
ncbi:MAG: hypothetical protein JWL77_1625 [Chthonomonadaceae bacterium]|nr:hypothetical protein [Chthonomonadaceae bacterium]